MIGETEPDPEKRAAILIRALTENWGVEPAKAEANVGYYVDTAPFIRFRPAEAGLTSTGRCCSTSRIPKPIRMKTTAHQHRHRRPPRRRPPR